MTRRADEVAVAALSGVAVLLNLMVILVFAVGLSQLYDRHIHEAEIRSQNIALAIDMAVNEEIRKIDLSLQTVASEVEKHRNLGLPEAQRRIFSLLAEQKRLLPETEAWSVVDAGGVLVFHDSQAGTARFAVDDRDYFIALKRSNEQRILVTKPLVSRLSGDRILMLARPFRNAQGEFGGLVAVPLPVSYLEQMLGRYHIGKSGTAALRHGDLELITRVLWDDKLRPSVRVESTISRDFRNAVMAGRTNATVSLVSSIDQQERITSFRRSDYSGLFSIVGVSRNEALREWRDMFAKMSVVVGTVLVAANFLLFFLYRLWKRQRKHATLLQSSLHELEEQDRALLAAQEAGEVGTYTMTLPEGSWSGSNKLYQIFGIDRHYPNTLEGWKALVLSEDRAMLDEQFGRAMLERPGKIDCEYRVLRFGEPEPVWVHCLGSVELDAENRPVLLRGTIRNITARKKYEDRLHLTQEVFHSATEGILVTDLGGTIIETNPAFTQITGYSNAEARGQNPRILKSGMQDQAFYKDLWNSLTTTGVWQGELVNRRKSGELYTQYSRISAIFDSRGEISKYCAVISDISELKNSQERLEYVAYHDELTGLVNRPLLSTHMRKLMSLCRRNENELLAVCHLDIDEFKKINDEWGHAFGDELLIEIARRLKLGIRNGDVVARLGGDEFVVVLSGLKSESDVGSGVSRFLQCATQPFSAGRISVEPTISVGVAIYPADNEDEPDVLIRHADQAMYEAKRHGKNCIRFFDPDTERRFRENLEQYERLAEALAHDELCLYYQPKVAFDTGEIVGVEALLRWNHPEKGVLPPGAFLSVIEGTDLTVPVGEWILHKALQQRRKWIVEGLNIPVSVNVFSRHLLRSDFPERLQKILAAYPDLEPAMLELEIVETTNLDDIHRASKCIAACRRLGTPFSLDDFGTGYSSLTYLRELATETVKIDRSFVQEILNNAEDNAVVRGIVGMAHSMGRKVVAEGVETIEHGEPLIRCGCDYAQGFGIARPMPPEALREWTKSWKQPSLWHSGQTAGE